MATGKRIVSNIKQPVPVNSSAHPFCYSLLVSRVVLFNYGLYEVETPFESPHVKPVARPFKNNDEMTKVMRSLWEQRSQLKCFAAGWGNPRKQFEGYGMPDHFERFADVLQVADVKVTTYQECRRHTCHFFGECLSSIWEYGFICAQAQQGGPCNDDLGAPLICGGIVFAIYADPERCEDEGISRPFLRLDLAYEYAYGVRSDVPVRTHNVMVVWAAPFLSLTLNMHHMVTT